MVSFGAKCIQFFLYRVMSLNPVRNPHPIEKMKKGRSKGKHMQKKGYMICEKVTENNSKYVVLKKDNNIEPKKVLYYLHGGAYIMDLVIMYERYWYSCCDLRDDIEVVLLDYSVAPEHKYPTQLNEAMDVWNEITKTIKPENIIVGGDSAGGNLALALINKLQMEMEVSPKACFFFSPWTDMTLTGKSLIDNYQKDVFLGDKNQSATPEMIEKMKESEYYCFIGDAERDDPYVSPVYCNYETFPGSLFIVGSDEMLLDDTLQVVEKIKQNGNDVKLIIKEGMFHAYPIFASFTPEGKEARSIVDKFLIECFEDITLSKL